MNKKAFIFATMLIGSSLVLSPVSAQEEQPCEAMELETISLSYMTSVLEATDFNEPRDIYVKKLLEIANNLKLKDFNLGGIDFSAYRSNYTSNVYEYSMSVSMTFQRDGRAVNEIMKKLMPVSISSSVSKHEC